MLSVPQERVSYIIHEILDMRTLSAKLILKCLTADPKFDWVLAS
jgi:hypothetical protein